MRLALAFLFLASLISCSSPPRKMNAVENGMSRREVVLLMGSPDKVHSQGTRTVLQYNLHQSLDAPHAPDEPYWVFIEDGKVIQHGRDKDFRSASPPPRKETEPDIKFA